MALYLLWMSIYPVSATPEEVKVYREPVDNVVDYIVNLLDEAAVGLPSNDDLVEGTEAGRVYNLVAKAMKARVLAYAASPLFNGNTDYASLVDNRGVQLFPQTYDPEKWKKQQMLVWRRLIWLMHRINGFIRV